MRQISVNMKGKLFFLTALIIFSSAQAQEQYISSAIIAFTGGAFERTIRDLNTALEQKEVLPAEEVAKAHFYRGVAISRLLITNQESGDLPKSPFLSAYQDLMKAKSANPEKWGERANSELKNLVTGLENAAKQAYDQALKTTEPKTKTIYLNRTLNHLQAAETVRINFDTYHLFAKVYQELGAMYAAEGSNRALANYRAAIRYFELSLKESKDCKDCISDLVEIATQVGDEARALQYKSLQSSTN